MPFIAAFMPLVLEASSGAARVVEPDVDALHEVAGDSNVVVLQHEDAAGQSWRAAAREDVLDDALARSVRGVGLAGKDDLDRALLVEDQSRQAFLVGEQQRRALVSGEAASESNCQNPRVEGGREVLQHARRLAQPGVDARFARENLPDHGNLLANILRWASGGRIPLAVEGRGLIDCSIYGQPGRIIIHIVNLTSAATWRAPIDELIPVGPLQVRVKLPEGVSGRSLRYLVSGGSAAPAVRDGWASFECKSVLDHEVVVIG
jgi:hypothetical protein